MNSITPQEQEYLKQAYAWILEHGKPMHTSALARMVGAQPASVTDMIQRLAKKGFLDYKKGHGFTLTETGHVAAAQVIRRHRLWELFLTAHLHIDWKEVHAIATELQSIRHPQLVNALDRFLQHPVYDPHGEVIPDSTGKLPQTDRRELYDLKLQEKAKVTGYRDTSAAFLAYIERVGLMIGTTVQISAMIEYNSLLEILADTQELTVISKETAHKIYVSENS